MASEAKIAANRRNAQRSTGPRSAAGKGRTRYNAFKHGLAFRTTYDHATFAQIEELTAEFSQDYIAPVEHDFAVVAAEAEVEILRVRRAKVHLVNGAAKHFSEEGGCSLPQSECTTLAFALRSKTLVAFDRYEHRALSRRKRALRTLQKLRAARHKEEEAEIGPPRPKSQPIRGNPFDHSVLRLCINDLLDNSLGTKPSGTSYVKRLTWDSPDGPLATIRAHVELGGNHGIVRMSLTKETKLQTVVTVCRPHPIGGPKWFFQCPETHKIVRDLYLTVGGTYFRSRHALGLTYRSENLPSWERHWARCQELMDRLLGAAAGMNEQYAGRRAR